MLVFVRPRAWWYNKVPLSVLMFLLLVDGKPLTLTLLPLIGLIGTVCGVANHGYALNDLFDRDEDRLGKRPNATETISTRRMWSIIVLSAIAALGLAMVSAGISGALVTAGALLLSLGYSIPPLRTKERGWLGVFSDALAAHVFPAMLAILIASYQSLRTPSLPLVLAVALWSLATGLRGILSHQLQSEAHDRSAGLVTVVHWIGHQRLVSFVVFVILPVEIIAFAAMLSLCGGTAFVMIAAGVYVVYEFLKFVLNVFPVVVFVSKGQDYIPFVDEGGYKVWGPLALSIDAAFSDAAYLTVTLLCVYLFTPRIMEEWRQIRMTGEVLLTRIGRYTAKPQ